MTTTTANAGKVMQHLEFARQVLWPELDVQLASVSEQWAQFSVAGPRSLDVLERVVDGRHDISAHGAAHLGVQALTRRSAASRRACSASPTRASGPMRSRFPPAYGDALIRALMERGATCSASRPTDSRR